MKLTRQRPVLEHIIATARHLLDHLDHLADIDAQVPPDGYPSGGDGAGGGGGPSDPTPRNAIARMPWGWDRDKITFGLQRVTDELNGVRNIADRWLAQVPPNPDRGDTDTRRPKRADAGLSRCANPKCPDDAWAEPHRAGRCFACWRYWAKHSRDRNHRNDRTA